MIGKFIDEVRKERPLVNSITNYITANDCANILLAIGASPIMADNPKEIEEIVDISNALNINMGVISDDMLKAMFLGGKHANKLNKPVILDPVAAGATKYRTKQVFDLLKEVKFSVIKGNVSEIKALFAGATSTRGVDASEEINESNIDSLVEFVKISAKEINSIIFVTGEIDIISDGNKAYIIKNGVSEMASVTGTGCMLSALLSAFFAVDSSIESVVCACCVMGYAGEKALSTMKKNNAGNSSYRNYIIDEIYKMTSESLNKGAKYELK